MATKKKKRLIAGLLLFSCIVSGFLLFYAERPSNRQLNSFATADSLIFREFSKFRISDKQVNIRTVRVDSSFSRKMYRVAVPPGFSKTQLHAELRRSFYPYEVRLPAEVIFPHKDFKIHLLYKNSVFRSITLTTDPELQLNRNHGSIIVAFDQLPSEEKLDRIISFGVSITIALIVDNPLQANELKSRLDRKYDNLVFWLRDDSGDELLSGIREQSLPKLQHLNEALPNASILSFDNLSAALDKISSGTKLSFIDASNAIILDPGLGKNTFDQKLEKFERHAISYKEPLAIVMGSDRALQWLEEELPDLKKSGLHIVPPQRKMLDR